MTTQKPRASEDPMSILTNFPVTSRRSVITPLDKEREATAHQEPNYSLNQYLINGVNFFSKMSVVNR
jgi:hypothetical protein